MLLWYFTSDAALHLGCLFFKSPPNPKPVKSESLGVDPKHYLLKLPSLWQYKLNTENQYSNAVTFTQFSVTLFSFLLLPLLPPPVFTALLSGCTVLLQPLQWWWCLYRAVEPVIWLSVLVDLTAQIVFVSH